MEIQVINKVALITGANKREKAMQRGLAKQSVGRVSRLKGTVEGGSFPHEQLHQEAIASQSNLSSNLK